MVTGPEKQKIMAFIDGNLEMVPEDHVFHHNYYESPYIGMDRALGGDVRVTAFGYGAVEGALLGEATLTTTSANTGCSFTISINEPWLLRYYREMNEKVRRK